MNGQMTAQQRLNKTRAICILLLIGGLVAVALWYEQREVPTSGTPPIKSDYAKQKKEEDEQIAHLLLSGSPVEHDMLRTVGLAGISRVIHAFAPSLGIEFDSIDRDVLVRATMALWLGDLMQNGCVRPREYAPRNMPQRHGRPTLIFGSGKGLLCPSLPDRKVMLRSMLDRVLDTGKRTAGTHKSMSQCQDSIIRPFDDGVLAWLAVTAAWMVDADGREPAEPLRQPCTTARELYEKTALRQGNRI